MRQSILQILGAPKILFTSAVVFCNDSIEATRNQSHRRQLPNWADYGHFGNTR